MSKRASHNTLGHLKVDKHSVESETRPGASSDEKQRRKPIITLFLEQEDCDGNFKLLCLTFL